MPRRVRVNKSQSARRFNRQTTRTKKANVQPPPMRGGYRL